MGAKQSVDRQTRERIAGHLRAKRHQLGVSTYRLATMAKVDPATLREFLKGDRGMGLDVFIKLTRGLNLDASTLLEVPPPVQFRGWDATGDEEDERPRKRNPG